MKVGDKVWVLCEVTAFDRRTGQAKVSGPYGGNFWTMASECRPVEPLPKEPTPAQKLAERTLKAIWAANDSIGDRPVIKESLTTESNSPKIPDSSSDPVNPIHYKQGGIECIEAIKAATGHGFSDYLRGNVIKYLWRYKEKGGFEDLRKSAWYLDRLIKEVGE